MKDKQTKRVPISIRALYQRINRRLKASKSGETLKATRGNKFRERLGDFYLLSTKTKMLIENDVDLAALGKKLNALQPWEVVIGDEKPVKSMKRRGGPRE